MERNLFGTYLREYFKMPDSISLHLDCMYGMAAFPDGYFDIGIVDPPQNLKEDGRKVRPNNPIQKNGSKLTVKLPSYVGVNQGWDNVVPGEDYFTELRRVTHNQIIWGANYFPAIVGTAFKPPRRADWPQWIEEHPTGWIIWDKVNGGSDFNDCELAWTSFDRPTWILPFMWAGMRQGKSLAEPYTQQGNKKLNEKRIHPTQKPVVLYKKLYAEYISRGAYVLIRTWEVEQTV